MITLTDDTLAEKMMQAHLFVTSSMSMGSMALGSMSMGSMALGAFGSMSLGSMSLGSMSLGGGNLMPSSSNYNTTSGATSALRAMQRSIEAGGIMDCSNDELYRLV